MSFRTVNGNTHTEDGWRCCNRDECDLVRIPDLFLVDTAPLRKGPPLVILGAWLYWYDRNVEEITSPVWGWSETNDVLGQPGENNGSNHLSATAVDVMAPKYPWGSHRMTPDKIAKVEEGLRLFEQSVFWGRVWSKPDEMHYQMRWREGDPKNDAFAKKLQDGYLGIYRAGPPPPAPASYGLPTGSRINYGASGFPDWVYQLANAFGLKASTYPGHQENNRAEAGFEPNPQRLNRGIDWNGPVNKMQAFADYCFNIRGSLEQVIWQNPNTGQRVGVAGGKDVTNTGYYDSDYGGHRDHVHTRQSRPIPIPGVPAPPPPPPPTNVADVLARAAGITLAKAQAVLSQVSFALVKANCTNPRRIAAALAQWVIESGHFVYTEEIANGPESQERWKYKGRTWVQLTWLENYKGFSEWCHSLGLVPTPDYFVVRPRELAEQKWAALGPAYWWAIKYPRINEYADRGDIDNVSKWVNAPAWVDNPNKHANHEAERRAAYNKALALGDQLLVLVSATPAPPTQPGEDMALVPQEQWDNMYRAVMNQRASRSPLREPDEGVVGDTPDQIWDMDGSIHVLIVYLLASLGHPGQLALLQRVASTTRPERQQDRVLAQAILAEVTKPKNGQAPAQVAAPQVVYMQPPVPDSLPAMLEPLESEPETTGGTIGALYDALEKMRLADALPIESRAPLAALISVLSTKNGAQL